LFTKKKNKAMTKNQKTFAIIGVGAILLLLFRRKKTSEKSLEEGAPSEEGMGGGGGGLFGGGSAPMPPVANPPYFLQQNITPPQGYVVVGQGGLLAPTSGLDPNKPSQAVVPISNVTTQRENPTPTPPPSTTTTQSALSSRPPVVSASKFTDFDVNQNFQDALL
jgi:hypothetical protein